MTDDCFLNETLDDSFSTLTTTPGGTLKSNAPIMNSTKNPFKVKFFKQNNN